MNPSLVYLFTLSLMFVTGGVLGQAPPQMPEPAKELAWLSKFVGQWVTDSEGTMGPDQPPMQCSGTLTSRKLGEYWVLNEMKAEVAGASMTGVQTIGFDEAKKTYVGTWIDSTNGFMWKYQGSVNEAGTTLTLEADGPSFVTPGSMTKFQDIYEFKSTDEIVLTSRMLVEDGKWVTFMSGIAKRTK